MVRYRGTDSPPLKLEICPETMSLVGFAGLSCGWSAMEKGQSAVESRICLETLPSLVDWISEPRTVRYGGPDSPQVGIGISPEMLLSLVGWRRCIADSPLRVSGQSAV